MTEPAPGRAGHPSGPDGPDPDLSGPGGTEGLPAPKGRIAGPFPRALRLRILVADALMLLRHGPFAPCKYQLLHVPAEGIRRIAAPAHFPRGTPATPFSVVPGDWDLHAVPWETAARHADAEIPRQVALRLRRGLPWQATGAHDRVLRLIARHGRFDGCLDPEDVDRRYRALDGLIADLVRGGRLVPQAALRRDGFREVGGIAVAIGRDGEVMKNGGGSHRLAIAQELGLRAVPVCVTAVHPQALRAGHWARLRRQSAELAAELAAELGAVPAATATAGAVSSPRRAS